MPSITPRPGASERIAARRIWAAGPVAIAASVAANLILRAFAALLFHISPDFAPLTRIGQIVLFTLAGALGAVIVFAIMARTARDPVRLFRATAFVVLLVSLVPDVLLLAFKARLPFGGVTVHGVATLMAMHVATAAITVAMLTTLPRGGR